MSNTPKRYRLLKDLPYVKAGAIYIKNEYGNYRCEDGDFIYEVTNDTLQSYAVENTPLWFEPVPEPPLSKDKERIEVGKMACIEQYDGKWVLQFKTNKHIHYDKAVELCNILEQVLNNDTPDNQSEDTVVDKPQEGSWLKDFEKEFERKWNERQQKLFEEMCQPKTDTVVEDKQPFPHKGYLTITKDKLDMLVEKLVNEKVDAIREETWKAARSTHPFAGMKFDTFQDYLNTLNPDNKAYTGKEYVDEHYWEQEIHKCKINPYYYATKYLTVNGKPFTTRLTEKEFNDEFNRGIGNAKSDTGKDSKEWEVVSFIKDGELLPIDKDGWKYRNELNAISDIDWLIKNCTIHSVKRLSDNRIISVGDESNKGKISKIEKSDKHSYEFVFYMEEKGGFNPNFPFFAHEFLSYQPAQRPAPSTEKTVTDNTDVACLTANEACELFAKAMGTNRMSFREVVNEKVNQKLKQDARD